MAFGPIDMNTLIKNGNILHSKGNSQQQLANNHLRSVSSALIACKRQIIWNENKNRWKYCIVENNVSEVLVCHIYHDKKGNISLTDSIRTIKCIFDNINHKNELICRLNSTLSELFVAIHHYSFVFEDFLLDSQRSGPNIYILVSATSISELNEKYSTDIDLLFSTSQDFSTTVVKSEDSSQNEIGEITKMFKEELCLHTEQSFVHQTITVLLKIWLKRKSTHEHNAAFIVLLGRKTLIVDENERADTPCEDCLSQKLNSSLEFHEDLCILTFSSKFKQNVYLLPGHAYILKCPERSFSIIKNVHQSEWFVSGQEFFSGIKVGCDTKISHCNEKNCMEELVHSSDFWKSKVASIQDIILNRKTTSSFLQAVIVDKFLPSNKTGDDCPMLCLVVRDVSTSENLRLYIPTCVVDLNGLLPNTLILFFNCLCFQSQTKNLYLKASSSLFGMQIVSHNYSFAGQELKAENKKLLLSALTGSPFICKGFIMRIWSVKVSITCSECLQEKCNKHNDAIVISEACFQVDDGSSSVSMYCSGDDVKLLLAMNDQEWQAIGICVTRTGKALEFHMKNDVNDIQDAAAKIFHLSCIKQILSRHVLLHCTSCWIPSERNELKTKIICTAISDLQKNVSSELLESFYEAK